MLPSKQPTGSIVRRLVICPRISANFDSKLAASAGRCQYLCSLLSSLI